MQFVATEERFRRHLEGIAKQWGETCQNLPLRSRLDYFGSIGIAFCMVNIDQSICMYINFDIKVSCVVMTDENVPMI